MSLFPPGWALEPANKVCSQIIDCINKTAPVVDYETPYKMIRTTNVKNGRINLDDARCVDEATFIKWNRRLTPKKGDIVLTREAPLGDVGLIRTEENVFLGQRTMLYRADPSVLDQRFLYYSLLGPTLQAQLKTLGSGSTVEHVRVPDAEKLTIPFPVLVQQKKIAAILSAYDDLIENNKRRIALLEKMAEEIYREWFVRFRFPGYQNAEFEKGIPKGWGLKSVAEAIDINPSERPHKDDVKPYVGMEALSTSSMYFEVSEFRQGNAGSKFRNGDTLFPRITPCLENGKKGFVMCLDPGQIAIGSTEFIVFREKLLTPEYIYLLSCFEPFRTHAEISMVGASGRQRVAENCFSFFLIAVPPKPVLDLFTEQVRPMFGAIKNLNRQNKVLDESKSMLLPRLISGKLSVEDLDIKFPPSMEEVV